MPYSTSYVIPKPLYPYSDKLAKKLRRLFKADKIISGYQYGSSDIASIIIYRDVKGIGKPLVIEIIFRESHLSDQYRRYFEEVLLVLDISKPRTAGQPIEDYIKKQFMPMYLKWD